MKNNREEGTALEQRITDLTVAATKPWRGKRDRHVPSGTRDMIDTLLR